MTRPAPIPLTVIGGFLGAGKTTLLNRLLAIGRSRCAVLVNDFGEINIDATLIRSHDGTTMSLTNGCVCCSIGSGFLDTLGRLLDEGERFERIVIEASGVGDPWRIAEIALVEPALRLDGVVVLADACRIAALLADPKVGDTVRNQFAKCDVVLLSKRDLVTETQADAARGAILAARPNIKIEIASGEAPDAAVFGRRATALYCAEPVDDGVDHESDFRRWIYRRAGSFDRNRLAAAVRALPPQLLRLKGVCRIEDDTQPQVFQMVWRTWSLSPSEPDVAQGADAIVLVGVGTIDLPGDRDLDAILDGALTVPVAA